MSALTEFYSGRGTDHAGRSLSAILAFSDEELEHSHDFVQWLFPLPEQSRFFEAAPILSNKDITAFKASKLLQNNMRLALRRMAEFYSDLQWVSPQNHNFLRITRILRSLKLCGLEEEARYFLRDLQELSESDLAVIGVSMHFWESAVDGTLFMN